MKLIIDTAQGSLICESEGRAQQLSLYTREAFDLLCQLWLKVGWNQKYSYTFSWLGQPIIQLPEDMVRVQEVIYRVKPDMIVETGVAHGGSLFYYASLCRVMGKGRVTGVDIAIKPHNRRAIEAHPLSDLITLIEGDSTDPAVVRQVGALLRPGDRVMVILDSDHSKRHVLSELTVYHSLVTPGSYIVATDGIMADLSDVPRGKPEWATENPQSAVLEFVQQHPEFLIEQPAWPFNESDLSRNITYWPGAWLRRIA